MFIPIKETKEFKTDQAFLKAYYKQLTELSIIIKPNEAKLKISDKDSLKLIKKLARNIIEVTSLGDLPYNSKGGILPPHRKIESDIIVSLVKHSRSIFPDLDLTKNINKLPQNISLKFSTNLISLYERFPKICKILNSWWFEGFIANEKLELIPSPDEVQFNIIKERGVKEISGIFKIRIREEVDKNDKYLKYCLRKIDKFYRVIRKSIIVNNFERNYNICCDYITYRVFLDPEVEQLYNEGQYSEMIVLRAIYEQRKKDLQKKEGFDNYAIYMLKNKYSSESIDVAGITTIVKKWCKPGTFNYLKLKKLENEIKRLEKQYNLNKPTKKIRRKKLSKYERTYYLRLPK